MALRSLISCLLLLSVACYVSCYRDSRSRRGGSYDLPNIGRFPAPSPTFPKNQGLPPYYHGKFKRSIEEDLVKIEDGEQLEAEFARLPRSVNDIAQDAAEIHEEVLPELSRQQREVRIIRPTYRTPVRHGPPVIQRA